MNREVFQTNKFIVIGIVAVVLIGITIAYFQMDFPIFVLPVVALIGLFIIFSSMKTKLVIEDGVLRYEKLGSDEEIELKRVGLIVTREVETIVNKNREGQMVQGGGVSVGKIKINDHQSNVDQERQVEKIVYVLDKEGRTFFSFPANLIGFKQRTRFRDAVQAINPDIEVF